MGLFSDSLIQWAFCTAVFGALGILMIIVCLADMNGEKRRPFKVIQGGKGRKV